MLRRMAAPGSRWHLLAWLPISPSILDYVENLGIGTVLLAYPNRVGWVAVSYQGAAVRGTSVLSRK